MLGNRVTEMFQFGGAKMTRFLLALSLVLTFVGFGTAAFAQDIILEDVVTAEIEKPQAFYVLRASDLEYEGMEPRESFLEELYRTVDEAPF